MGTEGGPLGFQPTDPKDVEGARRHSPEKLNAIAAGYRRPVLFFMRRLGFGREDAEDLTQEVFKRLLAEDVIGKYDFSRGRFRNFICAVAKNVAREHRRRIGRNNPAGPERGDSAFVQNPALLDDDPRIEKTFGDQWFIGLMERAMARMKAEEPDLHAALSLRLSEDLTALQIAERLSISHEAARKRLQRARYFIHDRMTADVMEYSGSIAEVNGDVREFHREFDRLFPDTRPTNRDLQV